jgi:hypothetical protein
LPLAAVLDDDGPTGLLQRPALALLEVAEAEAAARGGRRLRLAVVVLEELAEAEGHEELLW